MFEDRFSPPPPLGYVTSLSAASIAFLINRIHTLCFLSREADTMTRPSSARRIFERKISVAGKTCCPSQEPRALDEHGELWDYSGMAFSDKTMVIHLEPSCTESSRGGEHGRLRDQVVVPLQCSPQQGTLLS